MAVRGAVIIDQDRCKGCELCVHVCPQHVLRMETELYNRRGYHPVLLDESENQCTGCAVCALICPDVVFTVYRYPRAERMAAAV